MSQDFAGFPDETAAFLNGLKANNNRQWFAANKPLYERSVKRPAEQFCAAVADGLQALTGTTHRSKIFRIHRDLRFSRDKTPYNAHLHISFIPEGESLSPPCWFFGLDPDRLTLGAGLFAFDKPSLEAFRRRVAGKDGSALAERLRSLERDGIRLGKPELKRLPAGYPPDHPRADLLRRKSLAVWQDLGDGHAATSPQIVKTCLASFARLKPVYDWLLETGT